MGMATAETSLSTRSMSVDEWNTNSNIKFFQRHEGPYRQSNIEFGNHPVRKLLAKHFEYMSRNLFFISAWGRFLLDSSKEDEVIKAEDIAKRTILNATAAMTKRVEQAKFLLNEAGNQFEDALFKKEVSMEIPITTPGARLYAELLRITDEFYTLNSLLWIDGEIDNVTKFNNEREARKTVVGVVRGIAAQFAFILNLVRKKDANEAAKAGNHDEKQLEELAVADVDASLGTNGMTDNISAISKPKVAEPAVTRPAAEPEVATA